MFLNTLRIETRLKNYQERVFFASKPHAQSKSFETVIFEVYCIY